MCCSVKMENMKKIPALQLTKARNKKEVIEEARTSGAKVHFASLMDICHLKNAEWEMIMSRIMRTQLVFEMMIFRNSIRNGTKFYDQ